MLIFHAKTWAKTMRLSKIPFCMLISGKFQGVADHPATMSQCSVSYCFRHIMIGVSVTYWEKKWGVCSSVDWSKLDSLIFCVFKSAFRLKIGWNFANCPLIFENSSPLNFFFSKNFKIIVESSQIAHLIVNFILKNLVWRYFSFFHIWRHKILIWHMTSYLFSRIHLIKKRPV